MNAMKQLPCRAARAFAFHGIVALIGAACLGIPGSAHGQTATTWISGTTNGLWNTAGLWSGGSVPTSANDATFNQNLNTTLNVSGTVNKLIFSATATIAGSAPANNASFTLGINNGVTHTANNSGSFMRIQTINLGGNQTWDLNGTNGLNNGGAIGLTIVPNSTATVANAFNLNGHTLTKSGPGQLVFGGVTIGNGSIDIEEGSVRIARFGNAGNTAVTSATGSGLITVRDGAAVLFAIASAQGGFTVTKAIRMEGTALNPSTMQTNGTVTVSGSIASPIEWAGVSNLEHFWILGGNRRIHFTGNWSGTGSVTMLLTSTQTVTAENIVYLSGSNAAFSGVVDNAYSASGAGTSWVQFGSANAGSANAEWKLSNANASYRLNGNSVSLGALSGTAGTLSNGGETVASAATVTIGGKNIDTTFGGLIIDGSTSALAVTKVGSGRLTLSNTNTYTGATAVNEGILAVNGSIAASSGVSVAAGATVAGSGVVAALSGAGLVSPGNSPGILTAPSIDPGSGMDFAFELTGTGGPNYGSPTSSVNDVLRLTGAVPSLATLNTNNVVSIYFGSSIAAGNVFRGGTYVDVATTLEARDSFAAAIADADWRYYVFGNGGGTHFFNGTSYYTLAEYDSSLSIDRTVVADEANFGSGTVFGAITQFAVVPEPGGLGLAAAAAGGVVAWRLRRRKGRAA